MIKAILSASLVMLVFSQTIGTVVDGNVNIGKNNTILSAGNFVQGSGNIVAPLDSSFDPFKGDPFFSTPLPTFSSTPLPTLSPTLTSVKSNLPINTHVTPVPTIPTLPTVPTIPNTPTIPTPIPVFSSINPNIASPIPTLQVKPVVPVGPTRGPQLHPEVKEVNSKKASAETLKYIMCLIVVVAINLL